MYMYILNDLPTSNYVLTSNGVVDGFLGLLYAEFEGLDVRPDLVTSMVEHKSILKISHCIHGFSFLVEALSRFVHVCTCTCIIY